MMERDAEIGHDPVEMLNIVVSHPIFHVAEIGEHECESRVVGGVGHGVGVLVKTEKTAFRTKGCEYGPGVASAAEGGVGIDASGTYVERPDRLSGLWYGVPD